jgi:hypothetical protein
VPPTTAVRRHAHRSISSMTEQELEPPRSQPFSGEAVERSDGRFQRCSRKGGLAYASKGLDQTSPESRPHLNAVPSRRGCLLGGGNLGKDSRAGPQRSVCRIRLEHLQCQREMSCPLDFGCCHVCRNLRIHLTRGAYRGESAGSETGPQKRAVCICGMNGEGICTRTPIKLHNRELQRFPSRIGRTAHGSVSEPATLVPFGTGLVGLAGVTRRKLLR